jgi:hypothetical protein
MNAYDGLEPEEAVAAPVEQVVPEEQLPQQAEAGSKGEQGTPAGSLEGVTLAQDEDCPKLEPQGDGDESDDKAEEEESPEVHQSERIRVGVDKPKQYVVATVKLQLGNHNSEERNEKIQQAQQAEIKQVFEELDALEPLKRGPLKRGDIPQGIKALGTHLFTVEKFTASGEHEKFKS